MRRQLHCRLTSFLSSLQVVGGQVLPALQLQAMERLSMCTATNTHRDFGSRPAN